MYIYFFVLIKFCAITIITISIFTIFFLVLSVVLAQVLFYVSRILKLYVNFSNFWFVSRFKLYVIDVLIQPNLQTNSQLKMIVERSKHVLFYT